MNNYNIQTSVSKRFKRLNSTLVLKLSFLLFLLLWTTHAFAQDKDESAIITGRIIFEQDSLPPKPHRIILHKEWPITYKKYEQIDLDTNSFHFKSTVDLKQITYGKIDIIFPKDIDTLTIERDRYFNTLYMVPSYNNKYALRTLFLNLKYVLEPGDSLNIIINYNKLTKFGQASVFFSGIGAANNNLLRSIDHRTDLYKKSYKMPLEEGLKHEDFLMKVRLEDLDNAKDTISSAYFNLLKSDIIFENLSMKHSLIRASLYGSDIEVVGLADSVDAAYKLVRSKKPDLVFLDIKMPKKDGFELLESLNEINFEVIIVTAYNQYAIKAIRFCAVDYLLKPIDIIELTNAVENVSRRINQKLENDQLKQLADILNNNKPTKIGLASQQKVDFVEISDICRCESDDNYTHFFLNNGEKMTVSKTLKEFEELLVDYGFIRIHQSHLINRAYIKSYQKSDGGYITMNDGAVIPISRTKRNEIISLIRKQTSI